MSKQPRMTLDEYHALTNQERREEKAPRNQVEHDDQAFVFRVLELNKKKFPYLAFIFAIPNGGQRNAAIAGMMKAEGVKAGVPDVFCPIPVMAYHGLFIEQKHGTNKPSVEQVRFLDFLRSQGYLTVVCRSTEEALITLETYLGIKLNR